MDKTQRHCKELTYAGVVLNVEDWTVRPTPKAIARAIDAMQQLIVLQKQGYLPHTSILAPDSTKDVYTGTKWPVIQITRAIEKTLGLIAWLGLSLPTAYNNLQALIDLLQHDRDSGKNTLKTDRWWGKVNRVLHRALEKLVEETECWPSKPWLPPQLEVAYDHTVDIASDASK